MTQRSYQPLPALPLQGGMTQRSFSGSGADEDIVVSSARAYVSALNKMIPYITAKVRGIHGESNMVPYPWCILGFSKDLFGSLACAGVSEVGDISSARCCAE
jgi:hypothetical protein